MCRSVDRTGESRILYAIAESYPFDALLVKEMKDAVNFPLQSNLKRFRIPQKVVTRHSALDIMKHSPSTAVNTVTDIDAKKTSEKFPINSATYALLPNFNLDTGAELR